MSKGQGSSRPLGTAVTSWVPGSGLLQEYRHASARALLATCRRAAERERGSAQLGHGQNENWRVLVSFERPQKTFGPS